MRLEPAVDIAFLHRSRVTARPASNSGSEMGEAGKALDISSRTSSRASWSVTKLIPLQPSGWPARAWDVHGHRSSLRSVLLAHPAVQCLWRPYSTLRDSRGEASGTGQRLAWICLKCRGPESSAEHQV